MLKKLLSPGSLVGGGAWDRGSRGRAALDGAGVRLGIGFAMVGRP